MGVGRLMVGGRQSNGGTAEKLGMRGDRSLITTAVDSRGGCPNDKRESGRKGLRGKMSGKAPMEKNGGRSADLELNHRLGT